MLKLQNLVYGFQFMAPLIIQKWSILCSKYAFTLKVEVGAYLQDDIYKLRSIQKIIG